MNGRLNWYQYALKIALAASERSEDPFVRVGSCILRYDNSVAGVGYNGAPSKIEVNWSDRDERRKRVIHAEVNALRYSKPGECYLIASTLLPCNDCLRMIASYGIKEIYYQDNYSNDETTLDLAKEFNIKLIKHEPPII